MKMFEIRTQLEEKIREIGGTINGAGSVMIPPYTMDISFELEGNQYTIDLKMKNPKPYK